MNACSRQRNRTWMPDRCYGYKDSNEFVRMKSILSAQIFLEGSFFCHFALKCVPCSQPTDSSPIKKSVLPPGGHAAQQHGIEKSEKWKSSQPWDFEITIHSSVTQMGTISWGLPPAHTNKLGPTSAYEQTWKCYRYYAVMSSLWRRAWFWIGSQSPFTVLSLDVGIVLRIHSSC